MALNLQHQTTEQFAARFWARVRAAYNAGGNNLEFCRLIWWVWNQIQIGNLTSAQVRLSFNAAYGRSLTVAQWNTLVTNKLIPAKDKWLGILAQEDL